MDFIKTSSLRALIELTFQRNWNGLIWMSRKGVTTKRVKTVQTALSRISAQTAQSGWPRTNVRARPNHIRPSEVSAKVQNVGRVTTRETCPAVGHATTAHAKPRTTMPREPGNKPRGRATCLAYHGRCAVRAGKLRPASGRNHRPNFIRPTTAADHESVRPRPFRLRGHDPIIRPIVPTDRPNAAVDPKPVLKPVSYFQARLNPKPPLKT
ncbi:unnamed protein product [Microthlaspi erraticum]|uniref:Uncharacterized protein n=1 Tax=Microthlaspi erraticum TaxID=1685480 RepID=A0A6D2IRT8_9BRAS|nr:unnamed protein product [Microthlaspi erraticum]